MIFGLLASANADVFATIERTNGKKKMNGRRIFELLQFIVGGDSPGAADHFELQSVFIVFPVHDPIGFFARQTVD
jgi:hypothetical protein